MKTLTHFTVENERQLELIYEELKDQITDSLPELLKKYKSGITTIQCNSIGMVNLDNDLLPQSKAIPNPFTEEEKQTQQKKAVADIAVKTGRRKEIDMVLHNIGLQIEDQKLDKLIQVIDLHNEKAGDITIQDIFNLQN